MSRKQTKCKFIPLPSRRKSLDTAVKMNVNDPNQNGQGMSIERFISLNEKDSTEVERSNDKIYNLVDRIKLAAIHDNEAEIIRILSSESCMENGLWTWNFIIFINSLPYKPFYLLLSNKLSFVLIPSPYNSLLFIKFSY